MSLHANQKKKLAEIALELNKTGEFSKKLDQIDANAKIHEIFDKQGLKFNQTPDNTGNIVVEALQELLEQMEGQKGKFHKMTGHSASPYNYAGGAETNIKQVLEYKKMDKPGMLKVLANKLNIDRSLNEKMTPEDAYKKLEEIFEKANIGFNENNLTALKNGMTGNGGIIDRNTNYEEKTVSNTISNIEKAKKVMEQMEQRYEGIESLFDEEKAKEKAKEEAAKQAEAKEAELRKTAATKAVKPKAEAEAAKAKAKEEAAKQAEAKEAELRKTAATKAVKPKAEAEAAEKFMKVGEALSELNEISNVAQSKKDEAQIERKPAKADKIKKMTNTPTNPEAKHSKDFESLLDEQKEKGYQGLKPKDYRDKEGNYRKNKGDNIEQHISLASIGILEELLKSNEFSSKKYDSQKAVYDRLLESFTDQNMAFDDKNYNKLVSELLVSIADGKHSPNSKELKGLVSILNRVADMNGYRGHNLNEKNLEKIAVLSQNHLSKSFLNKDYVINHNEKTFGSLEKDFNKVKSFYVNRDKDNIEDTLDTIRNLRDIAESYEKKRPGVKNFNKTISEKVTPLVLEAMKDLVDRKGEVSEKAHKSLIEILSEMSRFDGLDISPKPEIMRYALEKGKFRLAADIFEISSREEINKHGSKEVKQFVKDYDKLDKNLYKEQKLGMLTIVQEYEEIVGLNDKQGDKKVSTKELKKGLLSKYEIEISHGTMKDYFLRDDLVRIIDIAEDAHQYKQTHPEAAKNMFTKIVDFCKDLVVEGFKRTKNIVSGKSINNKIRDVKHDIPEDIQSQLKNQLKGQKSLGVENKQFNAKDNRERNSRESMVKRLEDKSKYAATKPDQKSK